jgi:hypothetical protein
LKDSLATSSYVVCANPNCKKVRFVPEESLLVALVERGKRIVKEMEIYRNKLNNTQTTTSRPSKGRGGGGDANGTSGLNEDIPLLRASMTAFKEIAPNFSDKKISHSLRFCSDKCGVEAAWNRLTASHPVNFPSYHRDIGVCVVKLFFFFFFG